MAPIDEVRDWPSYFEQMRLKPGLWIGRKSLKLMAAYTDGVRAAEVILRVPKNKHLQGFSFEARASITLTCPPVAFLSFKAVFTAL